MIVRHDADAFLLALFVAVFPLVPALSASINVNGAFVFDGLVAALALSYGVVRLTRDDTSARVRIGRTAVGILLVTYCVALSGAALVGSAAENRYGSPVFAAHVGDLFLPGTRGVDATTDPFYPWRVCLTMIEGAIVLWCVWQWCARAGEPLRHVLIATTGWATGLALVSVLALAQYVTRYHLHPVWLARNPLLIRANATLDDPNMLGTYLVLGVGMALALALASRRPLGVWSGFAVSLLASTAVVTTVSRAALAGLGLSLLMVVALVPAATWSHRVSFAPTIRTLSRAVLIAVAVLFAVLLGLRTVVDARTPEPPRSPLEAVGQTLDPHVPFDDVLKNRLVYWDAAVRAFATHPLSGIGLGRYVRQLPQFRYRWVPIENAHNVYLQLLAEGGLGLAGTFVAFVVSAIAVLAGYLRSPSTPIAGYAVGGLVAIIGFSLTMLSGQPLVNQSGEVLWGSALGLALAAGTRADAGPALPRSRLWLVIPVVSVAVMFVAGAARMDAPPSPSSIWGYNWGLYPEEQGYFPANPRVPHEHEEVPSGPPGTQPFRFRWTGARALVELQVPPSASGCVIPFAALLPSIGRQQTIRFDYGDSTEAVRATTSDLTFFRAKATPDAIDGSRRMILRITASPSFVPAQLGLSGDHRRLGVQMFPITCE